MSKSAKIWLAIAIALILVGGMIFGGVMAMLNEAWPSWEEW